ncbi:MAG: translation initiation factor IF-2 [Endomicrobium sp.]|jgi:translation initiation factor IF-2|nr:translation initiation factor IF-2 [Endomicrobium sp.]
MPTKQKDTKEKVIKKKTASASSKSKESSAKKTVKKTAGIAIKKTVKSNAATKKTEAKAETKKVRTKTLKTATTEKKTVKKTVLRKKKHAEKAVPNKINEPKENEAVKVKEISKEEPVKTQKVEVIDNQSKKEDTVVNNEKVASVNQNVQKVVEQKESIPVKPEESKTEVKTQEVKPVASETKYKAVILINELVTVRELAEKMRLRSGDVLKKLLSMGSLATINQRLDTDTAVLLANEFGYDGEVESIYSEEKIESSSNQEEDASKLKPRSPIVTIMGHVDHGKTSLLDSIRSSNVTGGEHGGITQHIGAYNVQVPGGHITFLDTPGHEAFTAMRSRGSQVTDIVVLVVSATDGVMPQTVESINHAKAADVPIIVAINKIDMPAADPQKIRQELSNYDLVSEEWGGDTIMVDVSAKQKTNIDLLLEMILLRAEMMELKASPDKKAEGIVIEARLDSRKGVVATLLVQSGTLKVGDNIVVGTTYGKIRALADEHAKRFNFACPSTPVSVLGINEPPQCGDKFIVVENESRAREISRSRKEKVKESSLKPTHHLSLADISAGKVKDLRIILKADVQGSLGALSDALERLSTSEISLKIIHRGAGAITESDVALAVASDALIVGFNLRPDSAVERLAETEKVSINVYRIIYDLISDVKAAMEGLLDPDMKEKVLGKAVVKQVFKISSFGTISGCLVTDGKIQRSAKVRLLRDNVIIFEGNISSLKRFKDDVKEVEKDYECGIGLEDFSDVKSGDVMESFITEKIARKLEN